MVRSDIISEASSEIRNKKDEGGGYGDLHITGYSPSILLESGKDCQSFEDKTLEQIIKKVTEEYPQEAKVEISTIHLNGYNKNPLPYAVQYKESDYQFIKRLAIRHGEYFYYDGEKLVFGNTVQPILKLSENVDLIDIEFEMRMQAQDFTFTGYDAQSGSKIEKDSSNARSESKDSPFQSIAVIASKKIFRKKPKMHFNHTGIQNWSEGHLAEAVRLEKESRENLMQVRGRSKTPELKIGGRARISDINGRAMETYRIIEIRHVHEPGDYYNEFVGIPDLFNAAPYIDIEAVPKGEEQPARVVDNNDPMGAGRIKVQFPWQEDKNHMTPWIRTTTMYAGAGRGDYKIPEIGDEILVGFESGNAEKPFMLGALYNGAEVSGYHTPNNDIKALRTRSGIESLANDAEGSWKQSTPDGNFLCFDGQGNATLNVPKDLSINVGQNFNINVGQNVSFLVGLKAIYNIGVQMMMNTPILKYFIADNYHLQSPKTLINGEGEIKIEAKETNLAGTQKLFMHSDEIATVNSKGTIDVKGKNGTSQNNMPQNYKMVPVYVDERCLVSFRPKDDWNGKGYGFDWIRVGDTKIPGDVYYGNIMGKYNGAYASRGGIMTKDKNEFVKLMSLFNPHNYTVKTKKGKKINLNYCVPWLSLYPKIIVKNIKQPNGKVVPTELTSTYKNTIATLRVIVEVKKKPEKLQLEYDDTLFSITHKPFPLAVGKHEIEVTIICLKEFAKDQPIKVIATYKDAQGKEELSLAGKLKVAKNKNRYKARIVFIQVSTNIGNSKRTGQPSGRESELKKYMNQALVNPHFEKTLTLDLSLDVNPVTKQRHNRKTNFNRIVTPINSPTGGSDKWIYDGTEDKIYKFLNEELYKQYGTKYQNIYKVYFIDESNGHLNSSGNWEGAVAGIGRTMKDSKIKTILVYSSGFADSTLAHEVFHSMGLYHSFDNNSNFTFEFEKTDNIMDYSDIAPVPITVISTYHWQWKTLQGRAGEKD
ncbi:phage baseplate assembly protein V [Chryseobacterium wangxinyae]|uniref:phage baseplate assembly protein V n=1 Tax=Chryseobacterium sp. CY350 TaxID=2997336 RepID=UPI00226D52A1|nr:phage baseplate assembly protein V [Chryseobacterium sp. CY350]MCY0977038.1 phage baseplate assembly protein V [Chryseobacterium sp. CY350]WBZ97037.1 phage baseplate assembly protein V [Chryseobacterium sp. CY350]